MYNMRTLVELCNGFFNSIQTELEITDSQQTDLKCFQQCLETFLKTGLKEDAFTVYFCYCDIFHVFGEGYDNVKKLLEMLSDHEYHSGELLTKHRDHYSHSAYVFALGIAIYAHDRKFKDIFSNFYNYSDTQSNLEFLRYWGMTSLFHDIGYPFQLAHEQIKSYCQELWGNSKANVYVSYGNLDEFISISSDTIVSIKTGLNIKSDILTINDLLAYSVNMRMGYDINAVAEKLYTRVSVQPDFMDHGYFSSLLLLKQLTSINAPVTWNKQIFDVLSAILLHNSFNKYDAPDKHPISIKEHPLAYLLVLCDELQNWDRLAYGKVSKRDPIAWDIRMDVCDDCIDITYLFSERMIIGADNELRMNKSFSEIASGVFVAKILGGICGEQEYEGFISSNLNISAHAEEKTKIKKTSSYASDNNLISLYDFAVAIHASYSDLCKESKESLNSEFGLLPLEFKVSNIQMAKSYAKKLELINCFYSSRDLDYPVVKDFSIDDFGNETDDVEFLSREEHVRWVKEKIQMGWTYGIEGVDFHSLEERNSNKKHNCLVPYELLSEEDKSKDILMIRNIIPMLRKIGSNLKVYRYQRGGKPTITVAGVGHRYLKEDKLVIKEQIRSLLEDLNNRYNVVVRTSYAYGADQLIAECANEMGLTTKAILPMPHDDFLQYVKEDVERHGISYLDKDEMQLRLLLAQTAVCKHISTTYQDIFEASAEYNIGHCDKLIAIWDGIELPLSDVQGNPINRGGTYDCIDKAKKKGLTETDIYIVRCAANR